MTTLTPLETRLRCLLQEKYGVNTAEEALAKARSLARLAIRYPANDPLAIQFANSQRDLETLAFLIEKEQPK